ncbi:MAG: FHA domain-containing protein, partial [Clostridiales Family XIII bacterium]|nr:FHA domain-containing protein [Clostridiales Family XIII bacterium]
NINTVITLGTPYEGSPKLLIDMFEFPQNIIEAWHFPGPGELTPTLDYAGTVEFFNRYYEFTKFANLQEESAFIADAGNLVAGNKYIPGSGYYTARFEPLGLSRFREYCGKTFDAYPNSYGSILNAQSNIKNNPMGVLALFPNTYFFIGTGQPTIASLTFGSNSFAADTDPTQVIGSIQDVGFNNQGDDTVPYLSATMMDGLAGIENAADRVRYYDYTHEELAGFESSKPETIQDICGILRSTGFVNGSVNPATGRPFIVIRVACPVDVEVSAGGRTLSSVARDESDASASAITDNAADFGEIYRLGEGREIKLFVLEEGVYDVSISGTGEGEMDYALRYFDTDADLSREDVFQSVPITETTVVSTAADIAQTTSLNVDFDGDGEIDSIWEADDSGVGAEIWTALAEIEPVDETGFPLRAAAVALAVAFAAALIVILAVAAAGRRILPETAGETFAGASAPFAPPDPASAAPAPAEAAVILTQGAGGGARIPLQDGVTVNIGRDRAVANLVIAESAEKVSRLHCAVVYKADGDCYYVTDLSGNGTFLENMTRLPKGTRVVLGRNTTLYLADRSCGILLK